MIIANGKIESQSLQGSGIDANGYPVAPFVAWRYATECQISVSENRTAKDLNGDPVSGRSFDVLVDGRYEPTANVRLTFFDGREKAELPVKSYEYLQAVDQTRIRL